MEYTALPCMKRVIRKEVPQGARNEMARQFAHACLKDNIPRERALGEAKSYYYLCDRSDGFSYDEVEKRFNWVYEYDKYEVFLNCYIIEKNGYCTEDNKKRCELYHRDRLRSYVKKIAERANQTYASNQKFGYVSFEEMKDIPSTYQKNIRHILFEELECSTKDYKGKPTAAGFFTKEQISKLKKNMDHYVELYAYLIMKEESRKLPPPRELLPWKKPRKKPRITEKKVKEYRPVRVKTITKAPGEPKTQEQNYLRIVSYNPGITKRQIKQEVGCSHDATRKMLRRLEKKEMVETIENGDYGIRGYWLTKKGSDRLRQLEQKRRAKPIPKDEAQPEKQHVPPEEEKSRGGRPRKKIDMKKVIELKQKGLSLRSIAKILNTTHPTIRKKLNE